MRYTVTSERMLDLAMNGQGSELVVDVLDADG